MAVIILRAVTKKQKYFHGTICVVSFIIGYYISYFFQRFLISYDSRLKYYDNFNLKGKGKGKETSEITLFTKCISVVLLLLQGNTPGSLQKSKYRLKIGHPKNVCQMYYIQGFSHPRVFANSHLTHPKYFQHFKVSYCLHSCQLKILTLYNATL